MTAEDKIEQLDSLQDLERNLRDAIAEVKKVSDFSLDLDNVRDYENTVNSLIDELESCIFEDMQSVIDIIGV